MLTRKHSPKGIVSIVALGIFALLVVFGIIVANIVNQSYTNVKNTNEYLTAKALGDSALEFLEQKLQDFGPGYNSGEITCAFNGADEEVAGGRNEGGEPYCAEFAAMVGDEPVTITMEIKGRAEVDEKLNSENCGDGRRNLNNCYTIPLPGTGTAGKDCELYSPAFDGEGTPTVLREVAGFEGVDQVDFACNWNKLSLGSDASKSVNIPLYNQISEALQSHPFRTEPNAQFYLRLRTPCNCEPDDQNCNQNACSPRDRYQLEPSNEVLVDWQISGVCGDEQEKQEECGLVSSPEVPRSLLTKLQISNREAFNYSVLSSSDSKGFDNTIHPAPLGDGVFIIQKLSEMNLSKIKLMLLAKLKDRNENSIPHLEYQIIANYPLSAEQIVLIATISNADINLELKKSISLPAEIIDFAIQN